MFVSKASAPIALNDACREAHDALVDLVRDQIEKREKDGIPLDDETDFVFVAEKARELAAAADAMDGEKAQGLAVAVAAACSGGLRNLPAFAPNPEYDGVSVRLRAVSERFRIDSRERMDACSSEAERHGVLCDYVAVAYEEVVGLEDGDGPVVIKREGDSLPAESVAVLDEARLISDLWHVARRYAELPASKKKHFGSRPPSTSETSGATAAPRESGDSSDATAVPYGATGSPTTSQTPAPAGTY